MQRPVKYLALVAVLMLPTTVFAQATLTGTVRDTSGSILPGVTVEATSPVLIEKVRTATTDETGQYRIVDLRAGTYNVTFTLLGFTTLVRENVQLSGTQIFSIPVELSVGGVQETITVTGETPVVDVQNVAARTVSRCDVSTRVAMSASRNATAWCWMIGTPNWCRSRA